MRRLYILAASGAVLLLCAAAGEIAVSISFCLALVIHESGHIIAASLLKVPLCGAFCSPIGIRLCYAFGGQSPVRAMAVCLSGSFANIITAGLAVILRLGADDGGMYFILISLTLGGLNLLPVHGLDGGAITSEVLSLFFLPDRAYKTERIVSSVFAIAFWVVTVRIQLRSGVNLSMLIMSLYFLYSAGLAGDSYGRQRHHIR